MRALLQSAVRERKRCYAPAFLFNPDFSGLEGRFLCYFVQSISNPVSMPQLHLR